MNALVYLLHSGSSTGAGSCVFFGQRLERFCDSLTEYARSLALKPLGKYSVSKSSTMLAADPSHTSVTTGQTCNYLLIWELIYIISFILCKMLQALFIPVIIFISWRLQHDTLFQGFFNSCWICRIYQLNSSLYKVPFNGGPFPCLVAPQNGIFPLYPDSLPYST